MDKILSAEPSAREARAIEAEFKMYLRQMESSFGRMDADQERIEDIRVRTDARLGEIDELLREIRAANARSPLSA
jgi:hypothetical protein